MGTFVRAWERGYRMTSLVTVRRIVSLLAVFGLMAGMVLLAAQPAHADVTGGCEGSADFNTDSEPAYTPAFDTPGNPIVVPKDDGTIAAWQGSVPGANTDFSGSVEIRLGPFWIEVADWGFPDHDGSNDDDERSDDGDYNMDELWDVIPKNLVNGIYEARAFHSADGVDCDANFFVKFEGNALASPIVLVSIVLLVISIVMLIRSGMRRPSGGGLFAGRPVLAVIAALILAITIAIILQQFCVQPLNNTTVIILPIILIIVGLVIAKVAPFGGSKPEVPAEARDAVDKAVTDAADSFTDGLGGGGSAKG